MVAERGFVEHCKRIASVPYVICRRVIFVTGFMVWLLLAGLMFYGYQLFQDVPARESLTFAQAKARALNQHEVNWVELKQVHRDLIYAIVLSEDGQYFSHQGIDYDALMMALADNIKHQEWRFGASTISQQTVKNLYLNSEKTVTRKLQELIITQRLEHALTKNEILELYLNRVEFGPEIFGIDHASHYYFDKKAKSINAAEGAYLALLMPSPRKYHYTLYQNGNWSPALSKKHKRILRDMRFKELISIDQYNRYLRWRYNRDDYFSASEN